MVKITPSQKRIISRVVILDKAELNLKNKTARLGGILFIQVIATTVKNTKPKKFVCCVLEVEVNGKGLI